MDGPRAIEIVNGAAFMEQLAPKYSEVTDEAISSLAADDVLRSLGIDAKDLVEGGDPMIVDTGNRFMLVGVKNVATLAALTPDQTAIETISEHLDLIGYYVFCRTGENVIEATTRMFALRYGIPEEAATGMAAGPLGCLLYDRFGLKQQRILIEQGTYMTTPSPSLLDVRLSLEEGRIVGLMVGGYGKVMEDRLVQY